MFFAPQNTFKKKKHNLQNWPIKSKEITALIFFKKKKIFFEKLETKDITVKSPGE